MYPETFHPFAILPLEIQQQIWTNLIGTASPILIIAYVDTIPEKGKHVCAYNKAHDVLKVLSCITHRSLPRIVPIYLKHVSTPQIETAYVRVGFDMIYLDSKESTGVYDVDFMMRANSGNVKNLAIPYKLLAEWPFDRCLQVGSWDTDTDFTRLIKGLEGLEKFWLLEPLLHGTGKDGMSVARKRLLEWRFQGLLEERRVARNASLGEKELDREPVLVFGRNDELDEWERQRAEEIAEAESELSCIMHVRWKKNHSSRRCKP